MFHFRDHCLSIFAIDCQLPCRVRLLLSKKKEMNCIACLQSKVFKCLLSIFVGIGQCFNVNILLICKGKYVLIYKRDKYDFPLPSYEQIWLLTEIIRVFPLKAETRILFKKTVFRKSYFKPAFKYFLVSPPYFRHFLVL